MNNKDAALFVMLIFYAVAAFAMICQYQSNSSVSHLLADQVCRKTVTIAAIGLGAATIWYEWLRKDHTSLGIMLCLLIGLIGVFMVEEGRVMHTVAACVVFVTILWFMGHHIKQTGSWVLWISFLLQLVWALLTLYYINSGMFLGEMLLLVNFALFYLYVHWLKRI